MKKSTTTESNKTPKIKSHKKAIFIGLPVLLVSFFIISFIVDWLFIKVNLLTQM